MRRTNAESPDTFTAKLGFFDRTSAPHTDRLGVSCRVQADALTEREPGPIGFSVSVTAPDGKQVATSMALRT